MTVSHNQLKISSFQVFNKRECKMIGQEKIGGCQNISTAMGY